MLWLVLSTAAAAGMPPYQMLGREDQIKLSLIQRDFFEQTGRLPMEDIVDQHGNLVYSPNAWIDRQIPSTSSAGQLEKEPNPQVRKLTDSSSMVTCPDGVTQCDSRSTTCFNCLCYVQPYSQVIYGKTLVGANGDCIWSNCECRSLTR